MKKLLFFLFMGFLSINVSAQKEMDLKKEQEKLMEVDRQWANAASPEDFLSFISPDILLMAPDKGMIKGHEGVSQFLGEMQSLPGFAITWEPQSAFVAKSGDLGYTIDKILVNFNGENGKKVDLFEKGVTIWKKDENGNWKLAVDIWNVDPTIKSIYNKQIKKKNE